MNKITYICFIFLLSIYNTTEAQMQRVYINFESPTGSIRSLLLGFDPSNNATDGVDLGWDALNPDNFPDDLNWIIENNRYVIQGVGAFDNTKQYPFGLFLANSGTISISLNLLENFASPIDVYIYDSEFDTYTQINNNSFTVVMPSGDYLNKYYIAFLEPSLYLNDNNLEIDAEIKYLSNPKELYINVPDAIDVKQVYLVNLIGQTVKSWNITNMSNISSNEFRIPVKNISIGTYIIKVETNSGTINKKIIITY